MLYTFRPALLPISNYSSSSAGVRSQGAALNVTGNNILFLQEEFWINEFTGLTDNQFISGVMNSLLSTYPKSLAIIKQSLSMLECSLFCLATGQFYFANFLGRKNSYNPSNPNNIVAGNLNLIWSTQQPAKATPGQKLGIQDTNFIDEAYAMSDFTMKFPLAYGMWNIGFSMEKLHWMVSYFVKNNLAKSLGLGWPTETNVRMVNNNTIDSAVIDRWFNFITAPTYTLPILQNYIPQVSPEQLPTDNSGGQILGFGANNVMDFSFLKYLVAMSIYEGAIESYYTPPVPMNPWNIDNSKLWYRIGNVFGWGQVHVPNYWGTNYMFLDTAYATRITSYTSGPAAAGTQDADWTIKTSSNADNGDPLFTAVRTVNGVTYTATYQLLYNQMLTDQTQAQALLLEWEPNMGYSDFAFPTLPTSITEVIPGNVCNYTYSQWAQYRDLLSQAHPVELAGTNQQVTIGDLTMIGWNQMTYSDWSINFAQPQDFPVIGN